VYADKGARPDATAFAKIELFHSDVTYELQPPGPTLLRNLVTPDLGGDTIFSSGAAVYSSLSPYYQKYLESLSAVHSGHEQAKGARSAGQHVRREPIETVHPLVRVHPVTGIKSVFINAGFTRRIVGVPKAESDNVMRFLNEQFAVNHDFAWRVKWEKDDVVIWDVSDSSSDLCRARADLNLLLEPNGQPLCAV
jgi:sulfonate dioxygenase